VPGPVSITYWLGLAFQSPSIASVLLSLVFLSKDLLLTKDGGRDESKLNVWINIQAAILIVVGYLLLLDTFAILPFQMYRFGFGQVPLLAIALIAFINLFICRKKYSSSKANGVLIVVGVFIFAATRLPTGNIWDAILDPWLWIFLQVFIFRNFVKFIFEKFHQPRHELDFAKMP
jgi:dolichyl-phosphate-mannose--protein O-mannosyl transferase